MSSANSSNRTKLIVAGGLGVLLLMILLWDPGAASEEPPVQRGPVSRTTPAASPVLAKVTIDPSKVADWPVFTAGEIARLNPFDPDEAERKETPVVEAPAPAPEMTEPLPTAESVTEQLKSVFAGQKVRMIYRSGGRVVGLVGSRLVREGDVVDGVRIIAIRPDGLVVEPAP